MAPLTRSGWRWTAAEDQILRNHPDWPGWQAARELGRSPDAAQIRSAPVRRAPRTPWRGWYSISRRSRRRPRP